MIRMRPAAADERNSPTGDATLESGLPDIWKAQAVTDFDATFTHLAGLLRKHASGFSIKIDQPDHLYVEVPSTTRAAPPKFFGAAQIKKAYVSYHLMPVYEHPALLEGISDALRKRMQGKSCFNFTSVHPALFEELDLLTGRCAESTK